MKSPERLFKEIRIEILKLVLFKNLLKSAVLFLVLDLFLILFSVKAYYSLIVAGIYFAYKVYKDYMNFDLAQLESKNPVVQDMLTTGYEFKNQLSNVFVYGLFIELFRKMKYVSIGALVERKMLVYLLSGIVLLSFSVLVVSSTGFHLRAPDKPLLSSVLTLGNSAGFNKDRGANTLGELFSLELNETKSIFGKKKDVSVLGSENLLVELSSGGEGYGKGGDVGESDFGQGFPPSSVGSPKDVEVSVAGGDLSGETNLTKTYQDIIGNS